MEKELVFVSIPAMGHLPPMVELAKRILQRDHRISVVIIIINTGLFEFMDVNDFIDSQLRDSTRLTFIKMPALSNPLDPTSKNFAADRMDLQKPNVKQAVLDRGPTKPAALVLDMLCVTMIDVANDLHVPCYVFSVFGACLVNLQFHVQSLADNHGVTFAEEFNDDPDKETDVPGFRNRLPGKAVPSIMLDVKGEDVGFQLVLNAARRCREVKGILVNTYVELESYGTQALLEQGNTPPVYPVGPILNLNNNNNNNNSLDQDHEEYYSIMEWLDQQPPASVVFLCFGSLGSFDKAQVKEIANGLERAGHRFLWSLRRPSPADIDKTVVPSQHEAYVEALPEGFLERTAKIGKVIGWAPQVAILDHQAVGGYVSHCGWNSMLESMWFGVPMATWPMFGDHHVTAFMLVKEIGVAVEIRMDYRRDFVTMQPNFLVTAEEIENGVKKLMSMDDMQMREKVREISDKARKALQDGGSSHHWIGRFIADVFDDVVA